MEERNGSSDIAADEMEKVAGVLWEEGRVGMKLHRLSGSFGLPLRGAGSKLEGKNEDGVAVDKIEGEMDRAMVAFVEAMEGRELLEAEEAEVEEVIEVVR